MNLINDQKPNTNQATGLGYIPFKGKDEEIDGFSFLKRLFKMQ